MGYSTDFHGAFDLDRPLTEAHSAYLEAFATTRRMARDAKKTEALPDPARLAAGLPVGAEGGYYVGSAGNDFGQMADSSVRDSNSPPAGQPGLWCQWVPSGDGSQIEWDGNEKFYNYVEWLRYIITNFIEPWGYVLNGEVEWEGEDSGDIGKIVVKNNVVSIKRGRVVYE